MIQVHHQKVIKVHKDQEVVLVVLVIQQKGIKVLREMQIQDRRDLKETKM